MTTMSLAERLARTTDVDRMTSVRDQIQARLIDVLGPLLYDSRVNEKELESLVQDRLRELLNDEQVSLSPQEKVQISKQISDIVLGLGPLEEFTDDPTVTEIMVNGADKIFVERAGKLELTGARFHNDEQLRRTIDKIVSKVGRRIDESSPYVDARLPDGSRVNAVIPPLALDGPALTIRRFSA